MKPDDSKGKLEKFLDISPLRMTMVERTKTKAFRKRARRPTDPCPLVGEFFRAPKERSKEADKP